VKEDVLKLPFFDKPVRIDYLYFLRDKRLIDVGNINSIVEKYFLDALVELGKLQDDNYNFVVGGGYLFGGIDRDNPRCEVTITEV